MLIQTPERKGFCEQKGWSGQAAGFLLCDRNIFCSQVCVSSGDFAMDSRGALCPFDERTRKSLHRRLSFGVNILCCKGHCCVSFKKKRKKTLCWLMQEMLGFFFFTSSYHWCPCRRVRVFFTRLCGSGGK